jgi:hypothetical protein
MRQYRNVQLGGSSVFEGSSSNSNMQVIHYSWPVLRVMLDLFVRGKLLNVGAKGRAGTNIARRDIVLDHQMFGLKEIGIK